MCSCWDSHDLQKWSQSGGLIKKGIVWQNLTANGLWQLPGVLHCCQTSKPGSVLTWQDEKCTVYLFIILDVRVCYDQINGLNFLKIIMQLLHNV